MGHEVFGFQTTKDGVVRIFWQGRCVVSLGGPRGRRLAAELAEAEPEQVQYLLQRATGNFKRGNERQSSK